MNQLSHWNPFKSLASSEFGGGFDHLLRDAGLRPLLGRLGAPEIRIDVSENSRIYTVKADIPGAAKEDIDVSVDGRQVSITAKASKAAGSSDDNSIYSERSEGSSFRSFSLPVEVDGKSATAKYENGVLTLTLPKKADGDNHRVKVG